MTELRESDLRDAIKHSREHLKRLERDLDTLIVRSQISDEIDGYPAGGDGGRSAGTSNPTERLAFLRLSGRGKTTGHPELALLRLWDASNVLASADSHRAIVCQGHTPKPAVDVWCPTCKKQGHNEPKAEGREHCWFCITFQRNFGDWPPKQIIDLHSQGRRITDRDLKAAGYEPKIKVKS